MNSEVTTSTQSVHHTSTQNMNQEPATSQKDLKRKAAASISESSADFDLVAHDLKAQTVLCAELLNGEGIDRLPGETDADLASRIWASWNECKLICKLQMS
jgi:hypothetical protein